MPYPLTVAQQIQIGQVSMYLSLTDVTKKKFLEGIPYFEQQLPLLIALETDCLNWQYILDSTTSTLFETGNYLYALCGKYALDAQNAINAGGVVVTPTAPATEFLVKQKAFPQFVVAAGAPMEDGDTVLAITDPLVVPESADGEVEIHVDGGELGQALLDRSSYTPVYSAGQYTITFTDPVREGMLIMIDYPVRVTLVAASGIVADDVYSATLVDDDTETLVNLAGDIFGIDSETQGKLNIKLSGTSDADEKLYGEWNYYVNNIAGIITLSYSDGGIIYQTFNTSINQVFAEPLAEGEIIIIEDNTLHGVKIIGRGQTGSTIIYNATFTYNPFEV